MVTLQTERLILRPWKREDLEPFAKLNADPRVMEYFPTTLTREESDELARKCQAKMQSSGWGLWAVTVMTSPQSGELDELRAASKAARY